MEKRVLGRTGFEVSIVGFGGIPIQNVSTEKAIELLEECVNQGVNFIDTARGYNDSEKRIGEALKIVGRDKFFIATKSMNRTYEGVLGELATSMNNLQVDYIDLFQFHNVSKKKDMETLFGENGALKAIKEMKEKGIVKEIGVTSHNADMLSELLETNEFSSIQFPYNFVETQGEKIFERAKEKNIGVLIMKPLAGGAIPMGKECLKFVLNNPNVTCAIPGMDKIEQVIENCAVGKNLTPLTEDEVLKLDDFTSGLGKYFCRRCGYCAPCSVGIDIPSNFLMEGYYSRYDLKDWALSRYNSFEKKASDCIKCGICEKRCPYDLPIIKMLENVSKVLE
ncbi:MAG: aldo/keto reductase [Lagierella massiliensis]|nr:aldo/keto reductase [Lagierella massiliensis]